MKNYWRVALGVAMGLVSAGAMASGSGNAPAEGVNYIALTPPLVVNYGGPGKSRYIKAELSLRAENAADATEVIHHLPLIRDRLVSILSAQTEEIISTAEGKEYLRVYALAEINKALLKVEGHDHADVHDDAHAGVKPGAVADGAVNASAATENTVAKNAGEQSEIKDPDAHAGKPTTETPVVKLPSATDVTPVKGPASDLFFNNFVVQK